MPLHSFVCLVHSFIHSFSLSHSLVVVTVPSVCLLYLISYVKKMKEFLFSYVDLILLLLTVKIFFFFLVIYIFRDLLTFSLFLFMVNCAPSNESTQSISAPIKYCNEMLSTSKLTPSFSKTKSSCVKFHAKLKNCSYLSIHTYAAYYTRKILLKYSQRLNLRQKANIFHSMVYFIIYA